MCTQVDTHASHVKNLDLQLNLRTSCCRFLGVVRTDAVKARRRDAAVRMRSGVKRNFVIVTIAALQYVSLQARLQTALK